MISLTSDLEWMVHSIYLDDLFDFGFRSHDWLYYIVDWVWMDHIMSVDHMIWLDCFLLLPAWILMYFEWLSVYGSCFNASSNLWQPCWPNSNTPWHNSNSKWVRITEFIVPYCPEKLLLHTGQSFSSWVAKCCEHSAHCIFNFSPFLFCVLLYRKEKLEYVFFVVFLLLFWKRTCGAEMYMQLSYTCRFVSSLDCTYKQNHRVKRKKWILLLDTFHISEACCDFLLHFFDVWLWH